MVYLKIGKKSVKAARRMKKHLYKEHPSTRGKIKIVRR